jgi:hypothetical protein
MSNATRHVPECELESQGRGDLFAIGAILCAAVVVAVFALHGGPNLLGDRFNSDAVTFQSR